MKMRAALAAVWLGVLAAGCPTCGNNTSPEGETPTNPTSSSGATSAGTSSAGSSSTGTPSSSAGSTTSSAATSAGASSSATLPSSSSLAGTSSSTAGVPSSSSVAGSSSAATTGSSSRAEVLDGGVQDGGPVVCGNQTLNCAPGDLPFCSQANVGYCCGPNAPQFCDEPGVATGCYLSTTDCNTLTRCPDAGSFACNTGESAHCLSTGQGVCCGGNFPQFCEVGGCWTANTNCDAIRVCGDGGPRSCAAGATPHCEPDGRLACCNTTFPLHCEGRGCWSDGTDCASITTCGVDGGRPRACGTGDTAHCASNGNLYCCGGNFPQFCDVPAGAGCWTANTFCPGITLCGNLDAGGTLLACPMGTTANCQSRNCVNN